MTATLYLGDLRQVLPQHFEADSVDAVVCDPPYELSNDGKASASRVFLEFMLPQDPKIQTEAAGGCQLPLLVSKVFSLGMIGVEPSPAAAVEVGSMAFDDDPPARKNDVENVSESPDSRADGDRRPHVESDRAEHLGSFLFKCADTAPILQALNSAGAGFFSGSLGIGFRIPSAGLPGFLCSSDVVNNCGSDIGLIDHALSVRISALCRTENETMASLQLSRRAIDVFTAPAALMLFAILERGGAQLVRTCPGAAGLPSKLEARRIRVVDLAAGRAFTFDLIVHPQSLQSAGFMGKDWDGSKVAFDVAVWKEILRVLKPGGHLLAFAGARTYHRMVCAIEDAGFEIRDQLMWLYGSGMPKSLDVSKAIDKAAGAARQVIGDKLDRPGYHLHGHDGNGIYGGGFGDSTPETRQAEITAPATAAAQQWAGWGTGLKPAHEPIVLARKPLRGTVAANVQEFGTGALNIGASLVPGVKPVMRQIDSDKRNTPIFETRSATGTGETTDVGRWPANLITDGSEDVLASFPEADGAQGSVTGDEPSTQTRNVFSLKGQRQASVPRFDRGSAARFFYQAKADAADRHDGLQAAEPMGQPFRQGSTMRDAERVQAEGKGNHHPTVKPTDLMRYLVRLITPPGGLVLDPFTGSGSTGRGALLEGFRFAGVELDPAYVAIAEARINAIEPLFTKCRIVQGLQ